MNDGVIQEVVRPLMSGKEAQIYLVVAEEELCAAKAYKDAQNRSFKNRADYTEGRKVRNTRDQRAMAKGSKYGKSKDEDAWKLTEVDMIYRLRDAGVRVPTPYMFIDGVLLMELVTGWDGNPAPRLGDLEFSPEEATEIYHRLLREVVRMLCAGVVHGDLSDFNVLLAQDGPVVIDFPQSVNAAGNLSARSLLIRDVNNLHRFHQRWVPNARRRPYAEEMWELYENNRLTPETELTGRVKKSTGPVDTRAVMELIGDANRDEARRRQGAGAGDQQESGGPAPRRREVVIAPKPARGPSRGGPPARGGAGAGNAGAGARGPSRGRPGAPNRSGGGSHPGAAGRGPNARRSGSHPGAAGRGGPPNNRGASKTGPKRGDNVQASTYVSPEARKKKVKSLSPRNPTPERKARTGRSRAGAAEAPPEAEKREGEEGRSSNRRRRRRRPRSG